MAQHVDPNKNHDQIAKVKSLARNYSLSLFAIETAIKSHEEGRIVELKEIESL